MINISRLSIKYHMVLNVLSEEAKALIKQLHANLYEKMRLSK